MMKHFQKLMNSQRKRTAAIICTISFFIVAVVTFIGFELRSNQLLSINNFIDRQQLLTDQVSLNLQNYLQEEGLSNDLAVDKVIGEVKTTGNSYWFVANNQDILFLKDLNTTQLYQFIPLSTFMAESKKEGMYLTFQSFQSGDEEYTIGSCTSKSYIIEDGQIFKHNIYIVMPILLISSIILVIVIFCILIINRQETQIKTLKIEAIDRNMTIEQLTARIKKTRLNDLGSTGNHEKEQKEKPIYNKEVLGSLLAKINRENIVPLTIIIIELSSKKKIYSSLEYQSLVKAASNFLQKEHVLAEIIPGVYSILMFNTEAESKEEIKKILINEWALPLKQEGIKVRMGISCLENYDSNVENVFELVYREVSGMNSLNQIKLSS